MSYELVERVELASDAASLEVANIPQDGYTLMIIPELLADSTTIRVNLNDDTSTNYNWYGFRSTNNGVNLDYHVQGDTAFTYYYAGSAKPNRSAGQLVFVDYANTGKIKVAKYVGQSAFTISNGTLSWGGWGSWAWENNAALTKISFASANTTLRAGSVVSVYKSVQGA